ncbi:hypothetical protein K6U06_06445 [Acidiferrimicrobium sp. IK]|uniref:hypothetical protein n=1 Tax=Acidiferrimicrobium sp. IK TaxID=2871700 RepID=UPI0021CB47F9|nr:hypothetical protein [Acidiferrimicrobium sp. IK]MCU4183992.1 hypothetical protein [Acidiferrimicrobium sp. IK]
MSRQGIFQILDRLVGGDLAERLARWRDEGLSFDAMAIRLHDEHQVDVTGETIRRWVRDTEHEAVG